jgi:hypothetical protein
MGYNNILSVNVPFEAKARLHIIYNSVHVAESITLHHYKDQLVNAFSGNSSCFQWQLSIVFILQTER